jgi:hypothetical protein
MDEYSYTYTHPLGHTGPVTGLLYLSLKGKIFTGLHGKTILKNI